MVINENSIGKYGRNKIEKSKIKLDIPTVDILCRYVLQESRLVRMEHLVHLRNLLDIIDPSTYENDQDMVKKIKFIYKALEARLKYNLNDMDMILNYVNGGIDIEIDFLDYDKLILDKPSVQYCHKIVEDTLKYSFFYNNIDDLQECIATFKSTDISKRAMVVEKTEALLSVINNNFRKSHVEYNVNDVTFSLEDGTFESAVTDTYNMVTNVSRRLITGMQGLNQMIGGGFESGRVYMFLGVAGVGKSLTILNIILQLKRYNTKARGKDPHKTPCVVLLTMENTVVETITRMFDMVVDDSKGMGNYELNDVIYKMRTEGGLNISEASPLDIVIIYKPNRSISTDYLYTLYDDLLDQGKEMVCLIQDHVKRIRSIDGSQDLRLELGDVVNEFKVFAAEKDIPLISVSHLNRDATRILEEASRKGNQDNGKLIGKSNIGESLLMVDNLDCGITITRDYDKDGLMYMTFHRIKMRDKGSERDYIAQPFLPDNPIRLVEDMNGVPQFKETLHVTQLHNTSCMRTSGIASMNNNNIISEIGDDSDNTFKKANNSFNLGPVRADETSQDFIIQNDAFDDDISNMIIEEVAKQKAIEDAIAADKMAESNVIGYASRNPQYKNVITFTSDYRPLVQPIHFDVV